MVSLQPFFRLGQRRGRNRVPVSPDHHVPLPQIVAAVADRLFRQTPGFGPHHAFIALAGFALLDSAGENAMYGAGVIPVDGILSRHLPVSADNVFLRSRQHFEPRSRLVGDEIDEELRFPEKVFQRLNIRRQAAEHEPLVAIDRTDFLEVVDTAIETVTVASFFLLYTNAFTAALVRPAVETTCNCFGIALDSRRQDRTAMRTGV